MQLSYKYRRKSSDIRSVYTSKGKNDSTVSTSISQWFNGFVCTPESTVGIGFQNVESNHLLKGIV